MEDIRSVQGVRDNNGGDSGSMTGPMDWQRQWRVNFPCYHAANSNTLSYMSSRCLVLILFLLDSFFSLQEILSLL